MEIYVNIVVLYRCVVSLADARGSGIVFGFRSWPRGPERDYDIIHQRVAPPTRRLGRGVGPASS